MGKKQRWIGHYSSSHKILLVGEGDFSFSACLARAFRSAANMVATTLESEDTILTEHFSSEAHLEELERRGCLVLYEVNVYVMDRHPTLKSMKFDVIIFNFPHAGHYHRLIETDEELIEVDYPYDQWKLKELAEKAGLFLKEKVWFDKSDYPGYHNKRGGGIQSNKTFPLTNKECYTSKFSLKHASSEISVCNSTTSIVSDVPSPPGYQGYICPPAPPSPPLREILRSGIQTTSRCEPKTQNPPHDPPPLVLRPTTSPCNDPNPPSHHSIAHCLQFPEERISPPLPPSCQDDDDPPAPPTPPPSRQVDDDNGCCSILGGWYAYSVLVPIPVLAFSCN
ncbi:hypothetical protein DVH24_027998 [Malus domestica]|uniref:25S rRNA (uridine-N(3))-methyltransferase BMT5-like domain-containing protein n=1 Tax=Malus domestica TaxID=3750 RepID=A0A498HFE0_MALDO|nr:hypothetical protein DVH24_027998 [Malus domestica]